MKKVSGRFFVKKLRKKLLLWVAGRLQRRAKRSKSFLVTFFQKSNCFPSLP
jgi:hypothetical protein